MSDWIPYIMNSDHEKNMQQITISFFFECIYIPKEIVLLINSYTDSALYFKKEAGTFYGYSTKILYFNNINYIGTFSTFRNLTIYPTDKCQDFKYYKLVGNN